MQRTRPDDDAASTALRAVLVSLGAAVLFEVLAVLETQIYAVRSVSPWRDDPYNTPVSLAQLTVPVLAVLIGLRLLAWRWPGRLDRAQQVVRAAAVMTALAALTAACEWSAVSVRAERASWNGRTGLLVAGLVANSLVVAAAAVLLARCRSHGASAGWQHDWLGDIVQASGRIPALRNRRVGRLADWMRAHAMPVFIAVSLGAAAVVTSGMAVGEGWRDPMLIGWSVVADTTAFLAVCVVSNAIACLIACRPRTVVQRAAEVAAVSGGVAVLITIAFHDSLWHLVRGRPLTSVLDLAVLTLGAGAVAALAAPAVLLWRVRH
jgi:hypothetical protein